MLEYNKNVSCSCFILSQHLLAALCNRAGHYIFALRFLSSFFCWRVWGTPVNWCPKLANRSHPLVGRTSPYYEDLQRGYCCLTRFFQIVDTCFNSEDIARQSCAMVPKWRVSHLGSVTPRHSSSGRQPNSAVYSVGRPLRWALAHISSLILFYMCGWLNTSAEAAWVKLIFTKFSCSVKKTKNTVFLAYDTYSFRVVGYRILSRRTCFCLIFLLFVV